MVVLIESKDPWGPMLDLGGEDCFSAIDESKQRFSSGLRGGGADGPEHGGELFNPVLAVGLEAVEASCLEALEYFSVCSLSLPVASWVGHRGEAEPGAETFAVDPKDATGEL